MDKQNSLIPKSGGVEQLDSDDDLYDKPSNITSIHLNLSVSSKTKHLAKTGLSVNTGDNDSYAFDKYSITGSPPEHKDPLSSDGEFQNIIKVHTLNLNNRKQRLVLFSMFLFIWCIPTLILSSDIYANNDNQQAFLHRYSITDNKLHLTSMIIILIACLLLILFEMIEFRNFWLGLMIGLLYITGGCIHFAATVVYAHGQCYNSVTIDDRNGYCYIGYIGASNLGCLVPIMLGVDVILSILNNKYVRTITFAFILWFNTLFTVIALNKYGNGFGIDFSGENVNIDNELFSIICIGWWMLCMASFVGMIEIFVAIYILGIHKFKFERLYMKLMNLFIGFALIISVSFVLVEKDACITGQHLTDTMFCYYRLTYVLIGLTCVLSYELQSLS